MSPQTRPVDGSSTAHRQCSLSGIDADGSHQTTLAGPRTRANGPSVPDEVNAFPVGELVLVRHYFERDASFDILREYYDPRAARFEIPRTAFRRVATRLEIHGYDLRLVEDVDRFAVAVRKYSEHPEGIVEDSVAKFSTDGYNVFVMPDDAAVQAAIDDGAVRLAGAPVTFRNPTRHGTGPLTVSDVS